MKDVIEQVRQFVTSHLGEHDIADEEDLFDSGLASSLFAVQIVMWVEKTFHLALTRADLDIARFRSLSAIAAFVDGKQGAAATAARSSS
jgi:methoxymalonate biosynthesis acyl carrier protein